MFGDSAQVVEDAIGLYERTYGGEATRRFAAKLGVTYDVARDDGGLLQELFAWLQRVGPDMTRFFRGLSHVVRADVEPTSWPAALGSVFYAPIAAEDATAGLAWLQRWWRRARSEVRPPAAVAAAMDAVNPKFVLRNWLAQEAIDAAHAGDLGKVERLLAVMQRPFDEQPEHDDLAQKRPDWARDKPGCSALSCSS